MSTESRLDVYVSSTSKDLEEHREAVIKAIMDLNYHPVAMENYGAAASPPLDKCLEDVRACDVYVLLVAWRYGFIPDGYDQSITELEYREAIKDKPCLVFLVGEDAPWPRSKMDRDERRIEAFRTELLGDYTVGFFDDTVETLVNEFTTALAKLVLLLAEKEEKSPELPAPVVSIAHLPAAVDHFVGRKDELKRLDTAWEDEETNVISLVAFGGVGKSALVGEWLRRFGRNDWRGARYVFGHSFYSQGTREDAQASADAFIDLALRFFGDDDPTAGSPWDKGERLARLVRKSKTLLVLDGMEPLQFGPSAGEPGRIKDPALQALVKELAVANQGLCVISTREAVADIPAAPSIDLERLKPPAGAALLRALGVEGTQDELEDASEEAEGHGLALTLLGTYLRKVYGGDVRKIGEVELSKADKRQGGHARKLMEKYERWLGEGAELSILRLLGLFDRPAETDSLAAVRAAPAIAGLTESLVDVSEEDWNWAVSNLREYGLVAKEAFEIDNFLDAHPLVREHFAAQLAVERPEATREGHRRLYEHLKQSAPELPDTLQEMMPLYHAVAHGCKAGLHEEVYHTLYDPRIQRGEKFFSTFKLGAFSADLAAMANFFDTLWEQPVGNVSDGLQSEFLSVVGFNLRAVGRLNEAVQPMTTSMKAQVGRGYLKGGAQVASNLSGLYLTLGDVSAAVRAADQCVEFADRSGDAFQRMSKRTRLADALHQSARPERSLAVFREAEAIQVETQPAYPLLYSLGGFLYCDLLLEEVSQVLGPLSFARPSAGGPQIETALRICREVRRRAESTLEWVRGKLSILDEALDHLTLGQTYLLEGQVSRGVGRKPEGDVLAQAETYLNQSVSLLRQSGQQDELPRGLLARAALWRVCGEQERGRQGDAETEYFERAERDLGEVEQIAGRSGMLIWQIEAALERCRLALTRDDNDEARRKLDEAQALVKKTEKPYELHVPDWDEWEPPEYVGVFRKGEIVGYHRRNDEIAMLDEALERLGA